MRITSKLLALSLLLGGCPRKAEDRPAAPDAALAPLVSPVANQPYEEKGSAPPVPVAGTEDASAPVAAPPEPADAGGAASDAPDVRTDAELAAEERAAEQAKIDKTVDAVIARGATSLRACFDRDSRAKRSATLRLRVRAGYVTTADISGTSEPVRLCLEQTLRGMKFDGRAADVTSVQRKLEFKR